MTSTNVLKQCEGDRDKIAKNGFFLLKKGRRGVKVKKESGQIERPFVIGPYHLGKKEAGTLSLHLY